MFCLAFPRAERERQLLAFVTSAPGDLMLARRGRWVTRRSSARSAAASAVAS